MTKNCLVVNLDRCSGCETCIVSCKFENNLGLGDFWCRVLAAGPYGEFPHIEGYYLPVMCQQCENPACVAVCPTGASYRDEKTGVVLVDHDKCIGCKYCLYACPYGVRSMSKKTGVAQKCTLCSQLTADGTGIPKCASDCPAGARFFGDLDDPNSAASKELAKYSADCIHTLKDPGNAHPRTKYILSPSICEWRS